MQPGHDGSDWNRERLGGFLVSQPFNIAEQDDLLKRQRQPTERQQQVFIGQMVRHRWDKRCRLSEAIVGIAHEDRASTRSPPVTDDSLQDRYQPGAAIGAWLIAVE